MEEGERSREMESGVEGWRKRWDGGGEEMVGGRGCE